MENHQRQLPEHRGDFGAGVLADATGVLCKNDIERPVPAVLDAPMAASGAGEAFDSQRQAAEIVMHRDRLAAADRAAADDHADGLGGAPATERGRTLRAGEHVIVAFLVAPPFLLTFDMFEEGGRLTRGGLRHRLLEGLANLGVEFRLVVLHGQHVVRPAFDDGVGDFGLAAPPPLRVGAGRW